MLSCLHQYRQEINKRLCYDGPDGSPDVLSESFEIDNHRERIEELRSSLAPENIDADRERGLNDKINLNRSILESLQKKDTSGEASDARERRENQIVEVTAQIESWQNEITEIQRGRQALEEVRARIESSRESEITRLSTELSAKKLNLEVKKSATLKSPSEEIKVEEEEIEDLEAQIATIKADASVSDEVRLQTLIWLDSKLDEKRKNVAEEILGSARKKGEGLSGKEKRDTIWNSATSTINSDPDLRLDTKLCQMVRKTLLDELTQLETWEDLSSLKDQLEKTPTVTFDHQKLALGIFMRRKMHEVGQGMTNLPDLVLLYQSEYEKWINTEFNDRKFAPIRDQLKMSGQFDYLKNTLTDENLKKMDNRLIALGIFDLIKSIHSLNVFQSAVANIPMLEVSYRTVGAADKHQMLTLARDAETESERLEEEAKREGDPTVRDQKQAESTRLSQLADDYRTAAKQVGKLTDAIASQEAMAGQLDGPGVPQFMQRRFGNFEFGNITGKHIGLAALAAWGTMTALLSQTKLLGHLWKATGVNVWDNLIKEPFKGFWSLKPGRILGGLGKFVSTFADETSKGALSVFAPSSLRTIAGVAAALGIAFRPDLALKGGDMAIEELRRTFQGPYSDIKRVILEDLCVKAFVKGGWDMAKSAYESATGFITDTAPQSFENFFDRLTVIRGNILTPAHEKITELKHLFEQKGVGTTYVHHKEFFHWLSHAWDGVSPISTETLTALGFVMGETADNLAGPDDLAYDYEKAINAGFVGLLRRQHSVDAGAVTPIDEGRRAWSATKDTATKVGERYDYLSDAYRGEGAKGAAHVGSELLRESLTLTWGLIKSGTTELAERITSRTPDDITIPNLFAWLTSNRPDQGSPLSSLPLSGYLYGRGNYPLRISEIVTYYKRDLARESYEMTVRFGDNFKLTDGKTLDDSLEESFKNDQTQCIANTQKLREAIVQKGFESNLLKNFSTMQLSEQDRTLEEYKYVTKLSMLLDVGANLERMAGQDNPEIGLQSIRKDPRGSRVITPDGHFNEVFDKMAELKTWVETNKAQNILGGDLAESYGDYQW